MEVAHSDFDYLRNLVRQHTAIVIDADKEYLAEARLSSVAFQEGISSVAELIGHLRSQSFNGLHRKVLDAMTNNETWFFRDIAPFEALRQTVIPELLTRRSECRQLSFWSAASSSGQEAYTIAMLLKEDFNLAGWSSSILGTDISSAILERAKAGRYSQLEVNRGLPAKYLPKYFSRVEQDWQVVDELKRMANFRQMNLAEPWPALPAFDVVFLRNVLIYFDLNEKREILRKVRNVLRPDGYLFLGGAETTLNLDDSFERLTWERTCYYRLGR